MVHDFDATVRFPAEEFPTYISESNNLTLLNEGNNTAFDRIYMMHVAMDCMVTEIAFNFAIGLNLEAFTSGNFAIDSVDVTITSFRAQGQIALQQRLSMPATLANMTATGDNQIFIINDVYKRQFPLYWGGMLSIQIAVNETTGTGTRQVGILETFPYQNQGGMRSYSESGFMMHCHTLPNANVILQEGHAEYEPGPRRAATRPDLYAQQQIRRSNSGGGYN